jgi:hypothetical protein
MAKLVKNTTDNKKPTLWERTKEIAATYTGTFIVVMVLNQLLFFGFCLNPICIIAAMPHVLFITVVVGSLFNKIGGWGNKGLVKTTKKSFDQKVDKLGEAFKILDEEVQKEIKKEDLRLANKNADEINADELVAKFVRRAKERREKHSTSISNKELSPEGFFKPLPFKTKSVVQKTRKEVNALKDNKKVFITKGNLNKLVHSLESKTVPVEKFIDLYKNELGSILSHKEMSLLYVYKELCEDPELAFEIYKKIDPLVNPHMVYQGRAPSYHANEECESLQSDYFNIEIPPEIEARGSAEIERFRQFCIDHRSMIENKDTRVYVKLEAQFFLKNPLNTVSAGNTGVESFMDLDLDKIEGRIDNLLIDAQDFRNQDDYTSELIKAKGYGTHAVKEAKDPDHPLYLWHNKYKQPLKEMLRNYFRVKFNSDLKFEGALLDQVGFKFCNQCFEDK